VLVVVAAGAARIDGPATLAVVPAGHLCVVPAGISAALSVMAPTEGWHLRLAGPLQPAPTELTVSAAAPVLSALLRDAAGWGSAAPPPSLGAAWQTTVLGLLPRWMGAPRPLTLSKGAHPTLRRALAALLPRLSHPVGLPDAARAAGVSTRTLQRRCAADLGMPLSAWLTRARILRAVELLAQAGDPVSVVAAQCGYQSAAAFTRAFSQQLGSTPSAWRPSR
jgi:AraC-like DNA-binding protein